MICNSLGCGHSKTKVGKVTERLQLRPNVWDMETLPSQLLTLLKFPTIKLLFTRGINVKNDLQLPGSKDPVGIINGTFTTEFQNWKQ